MVNITCEHDFQKFVMDIITKHGGHASNVESGLTSPGIPDIDYHLRISNNLELKFVSGRIRRKDMIRSSQVKWFFDRVKSGGMPVVLAYVVSDKGSYITAHSGVRLELLNDHKDAYEWVTSSRCHVMCTNDITLMEEFVVGILVHPFSLYVPIDNSNKAVYN